MIGARIVVDHENPVATRSGREVFVGDLDLGPQYFPTALDTGIESQNGNLPRWMMRHALPPQSASAGISLVLLVQPRRQRCEIVIDGDRVDVPLPAEGGQRLRPRPGLPKREHRLQLRADFLVAIHAAAVERPLPAGEAAGG